MEIKTVATPQNILMSARQLSACVANDKVPDRVPLLVAPYIGTKQAKILEEKGISWLDLSGNMSIRVSNRIYIERTGKPNRFPDTAPIKKIFQGTSSLVSRALLLQPEGFSSLYEMVDFINKRNATITVSTVSKVVKKLQNMGLIEIIPLPDDKRSALLSPTAKGQKLVDECRAIFHKWNKEWFEQFNAPELLQILDGVDKLQKAFLSKYSK